MGKQYTPSIDRIRDLFAFAVAWDAEPTEPFIIALQEKSRAEFDGALDSVKANAWDEALELLQNNSEISLDDQEHYQSLNPYRKERHDD